MQDLWIVRHSIAGHDAPSDAERRLTHAGTQRAMRLADALRAAGVRFEALLHSPWQRAVETALLLEPLASARIETELLAASPGPRLLDEVRAAGTQVAVVGHMPWVAELASELTGRGRGAVRIHFEPATAAWLRGEVRPDGMRLLGLLPPCFYEAGRPDPEREGTSLEST